MATDDDIETSATPTPLEPGQLSVAGTVGLIIDAINRCADPELLNDLNFGVCDAAANALTARGAAKKRTVYSNDAEEPDPYVIDVATLHIGRLSICAQWTRRTATTTERRLLYSKDASKYIDRGDKTRALYELNAAINLFPRFLEAIQLKEELLQERLAEPTGSAIKDLIANRIAKSQKPSDQPQRKGLQ